MGYLKIWRRTFKQKKTTKKKCPEPLIVAWIIFFSPYCILNYLNILLNILLEKKQMFSNYELILQCDGVTYLNYKYTFLAFQLCFTRV